MIKGKCLCEEVQYKYSEEIKEVVVCHCDQCKRAQGTPFATNALINLNSFSFTQGSALVKEFYSSPNKRRVFCGNCGSPLYSQRTDTPEIIRLRLGTVTEGKIPEPSYEIYSESKSNWFSYNSYRPVYEQNKA